MSQRAGRSHQTFQRTHRGSVWLPVHGVSMSQNRTERLSLSPIVNHGQLILSTSRRLTGTNEKIEDGFPSVSHPQHSQQTRAWKRQEGHCPKADHTERMQTSLLPLQALLPSCQQERGNSALKMRSYLKQTDFQKRRVTGVLRNPPQRWSRASATQRLI